MLLSPTNDEQPQDGRPTRTVRLLDADPPLARAVPEADRRRAAHLLRAAVHELPDGPFDPATLRSAGRPPLGVLVRSGILGRRLDAGGRSSIQLLLPGDVFRPWTGDGDGAAPRGHLEWLALGPASAVVVDDSLLVAARRWPDLLVAFYGRLHEQLDEAAATAAMLCMPRIDQRVLALLWQLADRIGRVTPDGVVVDIGLTHAALGHLVGAKRPTVSLALSALKAEGAVRQDGDRWRLAHGSRRLVDDAAG